MSDPTTSTTTTSGTSTSTTTSTTTGTTTGTTTLLLPVLHLPSVVLPGTVVTISLDHDQARAAIEAAGRADGRIVLIAPGNEPGNGEPGNGTAHNATPPAGTVGVALCAVPLPGAPLPGSPLPGSMSTTRPSARPAASIAARARSWAGQVVAAVAGRPSSGTVRASPSRITTAVGATRAARLSSARLERTSWAMPMPELKENSLFTTMPSLHPVIIRAFCPPVTLQFRIVAKAQSRRYIAAP